MEIKQTLLAATSVALVGSALAAFETFDDGAGQRWFYVQDGVMGGVSQGGARLEDGAVRMVGSVSTANNGGFIQIRTDRFDRWPDETSGLRLSVRGNGEAYYVFLRTPESRRPGWSYRATFPTSEEWQIIDLPLDSFLPSSTFMPATFAPADVVSVGIVAYGRDHKADVSVRSIALY